MRLEAEPILLLQHRSKAPWRMTGKNEPGEFRDKRLTPYELAALIKTGSVRFNL